MKKLLLLIAVLFIALQIQAQAPQALKYQAVARDGSGNILASKSVSFRISILKGSASGSSVYTETHAVSTNEFGLANLNIGMGTVVSGVFNTINWGDDKYFTKIEFDKDGESGYVLMGTSQMLSVPYALNTNTAAFSQTSQTVIEKQTLSITGDSLKISGGNKVKLPSNADIERGTLKVSTHGDTLYLTPTNYVIIPGSSAANFPGLDSVIYPKNALYGTNILSLTDTVYTLNDWHSLSAQLPAGTSLNVTLKGIDSLLTWAYVVGSVHNWGISSFHYVHSYSSQTFTAMGSNLSCDLKFLFDKVGYYQIEYYEFGSGSPTRTKRIHVK